MKEGLFIGYDLCKDYCRISVLREGEEEPADFAFSDEENPYIVQNSICKKKGADSWFVGEQAYEAALHGSGAIVNKLLKLVYMDGFSTFDGKRYSAEDLLYHFIRESLAGVFREWRTDKVAGIMFTLQEPDMKIRNTLLHCTDRMGIPAECVHVTSHTESFLYFAISQKRELWTNLSVLYDLSGDGLNFYEMETIRGMNPNVARATHTFLEEGFSTDILRNPAGQRMADNILSNCIERMLSKKVISAMYLSGNGMESCQQWGPKFIERACQRRRVFYIENLFAKGAAYAAADMMREASVYPFRFMCEGHIDFDVYLEVYKGVNRQNLVIAYAGENWFDASADFDFIADGEEELSFVVKSLEGRTVGDIVVPLQDFKKDGRRENRFHASVRFENEKAFSVEVSDKGFGDYFPATDITVRKSFRIGM